MDLNTCVNSPETLPKFRTFGFPWMMMITNLDVYCQDKVWLGYEPSTVVFSSLWYFLFAWPLVPEICGCASLYWLWPYVQKTLACRCKISNDHARFGTDRVAKALTFKACGFDHHKPEGASRYHPCCTQQLWACSALCGLLNAKDCKQMRRPAAVAMQLTEHVCTSQLQLKSTHLLRFPTQENTDALQIVVNLHKKIL